MAIGPAHYRFYDTVGRKGVTLNVAHFVVVAESPKCWYVVPRELSYLADRGDAAKAHSRCKRILKAPGGRRYAYPDLGDALRSYAARKRWQRNHANAALARAEAGQAQAMLMLSAGPILPLEQPIVCPHGEYFREMNWDAY